MRTLIERLLRLVMPADDASALLGDLEESYQASRRERGWLRARAGLLRELSAAIRHADPPRPPRRIPFVAADLRYALRRWRRRPGFALAAIATLAIGIGATTAIYSVISTVLLAPPPWPEPERLVAIHAVWPERRANPAQAANWNRGMFSYPAWDALRARPEFESVAAWRQTGLDTTFGADRTQLVHTMSVSSQFLPALGVPLLHGRSFNVDEDTRPTDSVIVTYEAWQRLFGGRPDIIGAVETIGSANSGGRRKAIVIGVTAQGFAFEGKPELLLPAGIGSETGHQYPGPTWRIVARLAPGVSHAASAGAADAIARAVERREPTSARLVPLADEQWRGAAQPLWVLFAGAAMLLLVACANVAGLLLGETRARRHEIAVRAALGGTRARVVRQLVVEHALLAMAGAVVGIGLAYLLMQAFVAAAPAALPRVETIAIDQPLALFALALGATTLVLFGVAPALTIARTRAAAELADGGRDGAPGRLAGQRLVVAGAIALALTLLVGAHLLGESLYRLSSRPLGFEPGGLAVISFKMTDLPPQLTPPPGAFQRITSATERARWLDEFFRVRSAGWWTHMEGAMRDLAALPAVTGVAGAYSPPFTGTRPTWNVVLDGRPAADVIAVRQTIVTPTYFDVMRVPILRGRTFEASDQVFDPRRTPAVPRSRAVIISRELERRLFESNGVGRTLTYVAGTDRLPLHVVGVADDMRWRGFDDDDLAMIYSPASTINSVNTLLIRTRTDPAAVLAPARGSLNAYDRKFVITSTTTMAAVVERSLAEYHLRASLSAIFGGAALVLATVGLYGLATRRVADRRREIGVRVALGAQARDVRRLVLRDAFLTSTAGILAGLPLALVAARVTQSLLFGVDVNTPRVFLVAAGVLVVASAAAALLPARRAAAIDPILVLKG